MKRARKKGVPPATPVAAWAPGWDEGAFGRFLEAIDAWFRGRGREFEVTPSGVKSAGREYALDAVAETCLRMAAANWARVVARHFERADETAKAVDSIKGRPDLAEIGGRLRVRVYPERYLDTSEGSTAVNQPVAPGLVAVLVIGEGGDAKPLTAEQADSWGISTPALFEAARRNHVRRQVRREKAPEFEIGILMAEDHATASEMMFLEHYIPVDPPAGTLVTVPTQNSMLFHEIRDGGVMNALQTLIVVGHGLFQDGPAAILPVLYWWRRRRFATLPIEVKGESLRFLPPVEFVAALERIGVQLSD